MECFQWDSYIEDVDCLKKSLTNNPWATDEELSSKNEAEVKNLLIEKLNFYFDGEIHSIGLTFINTKLHTYILV